MLNAEVEISEQKFSASNFWCTQRAGVELAMSLDPVSEKKTPNAPLMREDLPELVKSSDRGTEGTVDFFAG